MKKKAINQLALGMFFLTTFILFTVSLTMVDIQPIGPGGSAVAYAGINKRVHELLGVNMLLYRITDWAGVAAIMTAFGFACVGLAQWIKRKRLCKVDSSILALGAFYILVFGVYAYFELHVINYRPILINGVLEASYPSSTTMLALCVMPTAMMQFRRLIKNMKLRICVNALCGLFTAFMVIGRLLCGAHWFTDIFGGMLFGTAMILLYSSANSFFPALSFEKRL